MENKEEVIDKKSQEEVEKRNKNEKDSLNKLILLFEDIKLVESSNQEYVEDILESPIFANESNIIMENVGNLCYHYLDNYYKVRKKHIQNISEILEALKERVFQKKPTSEKNVKKSKEGIEKKYLGGDDIKIILEKTTKLFDIENELKTQEDFKIEFQKKINELKEDESLVSLEEAKKIKEEKVKFLEKYEDISKKGTKSEHYNEILELIKNDDSEKQIKVEWVLNFLNKNRAKLYIVSDEVYESLKIFFDIFINKLVERKLYPLLDLAIILLQTFNKVDPVNNVNVLIETEFKNHKFAKDKENWYNLLLTKVDSMLNKIKGASSDVNAHRKYVKENIEPILISNIFTMKDFNVEDTMILEILKEFCEEKKYEQYMFSYEDFKKLVEKK